LIVDGVLRTEVKEFPFSAFKTGMKICKVWEVNGGAVHIGDAKTCTKARWTEVSSGGIPIDHSCYSCSYGLHCPGLALADQDQKSTNPICNGTIRLLD
jgi:hypothetical protein